METPYWCTFLVHQYVRREINKNIWSSLFLLKLFLFTREVAYVRINISSNTWRGYTAENQEERLFFNETAFLFWCHAMWKLGSSICCIFKMKHATEMDTCTKIYFLFVFNLEYIKIRKASLFWLHNLMTSQWKPSIVPSFVFGHAAPKSRDITHKPSFNFATFPLYYGCSTAFRKS